MLGSIFSAGRHTHHDRGKRQPLPPPPFPVQVVHALSCLGARNILASPVIPVNATQLQAGAPLPEMALITCAHRTPDGIILRATLLRRYVETAPAGFPLDPGAYTLQTLFQERPRGEGRNSS